jgi:sigma-B regulation protein RsbU (phosphoserine phosphatase)
VIESLKPNSRRKRRIVIIEDDEDFAQALTKMLSILGYEFTISTDASFVFDVTGNDIVFLDVLMPGTSGHQVLEQMAYHGSKCPIVLISGTLEKLEDAEKYAESLNLNLIGALEKPFRIADVRDVLDGL